MRKAVGIHVFAGAFTQGVQRVFDVECQLESHGFGGETVEKLCKIPFVNDEKARWPEVHAEFAYANPRCTGFSCLSAGSDEDAHGPWARQCEDIHDLCNYAAGKYDIIIWESVQQAITVGMPLLDYLTADVFAPKNYRVAHVLLNASSFGNAQNRKRYFYVAYRDDRNFNITPPVIDPYYSTVYDHIYSMRDRETRSVDYYKEEYDADTSWRMNEHDEHAVKSLPNGWGLNTLAKFRGERLSQKYRDVWEYRNSDMPFSLHCVHRLPWLRPCPTIHSGARMLVHPEHDRTLTIGELAKLMGWEGIPSGPKPVEQIAKGVVPAAGEWLARQALDYLDDKWGDDDWESSYDPVKCEWVGRQTKGERVKWFDMTKYTGQLFDRERYDIPDSQLHRHHAGNRPFTRL